MIALLLYFFIVKEADGKIVKDIDGNSYKTIDIGSQVWLSENLKTSRFRNGDTIPNVKEPEEWEALASPGWCYNNNDSASGIYGKLYNWFAVNDPRGICPEGWHIPSKSEIQDLIRHLGGDSLAAQNLRTIDSTMLSASALAGYRSYTGQFRRFGNYCGLWTSTEGNIEFAWLFYTDCSQNDPAINQIFLGKKNALPCKCIGD